MISTTAIIIGFIAVLVWAFWGGKSAPQVTVVQPPQDDPAPTDNALKAAGHVVASYNDVLAAKSTGIIVDENLLPYPKSTIKTAIRLLLAQTSDPGRRDHLRGAYLHLSEFQAGAPAEGALGDERRFASGALDPHELRTLAQFSADDPEIIDRSADEMKTLIEELRY